MTFAVYAHFIHLVYFI